MVKTGLICCCSDICPVLLEPLDTDREDSIYSWYLKWLNDGQPQ